VHPVDVEYARCEDADIAKIEVEQLARNAAEMEGPLTRAIRTLDRQPHQRGEWP
jgi:hypothetical protein